jgi:hypothetical protein
MISALAAQQNLLYRVTRVTWDEKKRKGDDGDASVVRGYVVDPIKNDVTVFHVDTKELSPATTCQFLWDYVAASGISSKWKKV